MRTGNVSCLKIERIRQRIDESLPTLSPTSAFYRQHPEQLDFYMKRLAADNLDGLISVLSSFHKAGVSIRKKGEVS